MLIVPKTTHLLKNSILIDVLNLLSLDHTALDREFLFPYVKEEERKKRRRTHQDELLPTKYESV